MARQARMKAEYLHIIVRGIGKQILFEDDSDYRYFLYLLEKNKRDCGIQILAYCLMENHVHLLLRDENMRIDLFMKKIGVSYAYYFNNKYERIGHLFQDRYKSEIITNDTSLVAVYRYILRNPEKAGIARATGYPWNSFHEYGKKGGLTDSTILYNMIGSSEVLVDLLKIPENEEFMEDVPYKHDDAWALNIIRDTLNSSSGTVVQNMPKRQRDEILGTLKLKGLSIRQLERLTGVSRGVVQKAKVVKENRPQ